MLGCLTFSTKKNPQLPHLLLSKDWGYNKFLSLRYPLGRSNMVMKIPNSCAWDQKIVTVLVLLIVQNMLHDNCMYHALIYTLSYPRQLKSS
jgi:hypothetical protein